MRCFSGIICLLFTPYSVVGAPVNLVQTAQVLASSHREKNPPFLATDGKVHDGSRWLAVPSDPSPTLEIIFPKPVKIGVIDLYTGFEDEPPLADFQLVFEKSGVVECPEAGVIRGNTENPRRIQIKMEGVTRLRFEAPPKNPARVREIAVYESSLIPQGAELTGNRLPIPKIPRDIHLIAVNQIGYETSQPKRFTAPISPDGTAFIIRKEKGHEVLFQGAVRGNIGDFSEFRPKESHTDYVIEMSGGALKTNVSDPFAIRANLWQEVFWQPAVDFFIDTRSVVGTHPSAYGGCPWRDGTYYDYILPALVLLISSDEGFVLKMPKQIDWAADKARIMDPAFKFDPNTPNGANALDVARKYYTDFEPPNPDAPDVVKLLHWGTCYYLIQPATADPSKDPAGKKIHHQTVEQMAYVIEAWPLLKKWLPVSFYNQCRDFCFQHWDNSLGIDEWWSPDSYLTPEDVTSGSQGSELLHPYKGRHAPGNSIGANMKMYQIAKRENRPDADRFLDNAVAQADWIVKNLDWNDPRTTKGQRVSEHRTIPNLAWLLMTFPEKAPPGLKEKFTRWAEVAIRRSDNLWDFRKYDDGDEWTVPKLNDVGNVVGFPSIALAASWVVDDPKMKARLREMAASHIDYAFGRNPRLAATVHQPEPSFPGIERGWPVGFPNDVCARLELCRGSISSSPGSEMFPFNPEGAFRHPEGWVNYGAGWSISLSYLKFDEYRMRGK